LEVDPVTGVGYLDVSPMMSSHIVVWDDDASGAVRGAGGDRLRPGTSTNQEWQEHDLVVWDNIVLQHGRNEFPGPGTRTMRRVLANPYELITLNVSGATPPRTPVSAS
jgi:taurine dioxygenase